MGPTAYPTVGVPYDAHPLADLLPLITGAEFDALVADIRQHGLRVPITIFQDRILDGRNRLRACKVAEVEPRFEHFDGDEDDALAFVLSLNVARRHLTTCQRAVLALKLLPLEEERARERQGNRTDLHQDSDEGGGQALDQAGARVSVSRDTVWKAKRIAEHSPDVIAAMVEGVVRSMPEAQRLAHVPTRLRPAVVKVLRQRGGRVNDALRAARSEEQAGRAERPLKPVVVEEPGVRLLYGQHVLDALQTLADDSIHTAITSPPYWGSLRDYGAPPTTWGGDSTGNCQHEWGHPGRSHHRGQVEQTKWASASAAGAGQNGGTGCFCKNCDAWRGQLGHEPTVGLYVEHLVAVFDELRRVLRPDSTAWLVIGDCFTTQHQAHGGLKPKDLVMGPHRVALALQARGWWVRQDIVFDKVNAMPSSVTDRPTRSHEYVFLLGHPDGDGRYYYDADAIREPFTDPRPKLDRRGRQRDVGGRADGHTRPHGINPQPHSGRNRRSVWSLPTQPYPEAHFASFPEKLIEPMILAATSAAGACKACVTPWSREVQRGEPVASDGGPAHGAAYGEAARAGRPVRQMGASSSGTAGKGFGVREAETTGWRPSCDCGVDVVPCLVLDPFSGSGTTGKVARDHGRSYVGIDLNAEYLELAKKRIGISDDGGK